MLLLRTMLSQGLVTHNVQAWVRGQTVGGSIRLSTIYMYIKGGGRGIHVPLSSSWKQMFQESALLICCSLGELGLGGNCIVVGCTLLGTGCKATFEYCIDQEADTADGGDKVMC